MEIYVINNNKIGDFFWALNIWQALAYLILNLKILV